MMQDKDVVEIQEIWTPCETGGEAVYYGNGRLQKMKMVVRIIDGTPEYIDPEFVVQKKYKTRKVHEYEKSQSNNR